MESLNFIIERVIQRQKDLGDKFNISQMRSIIREKTTPLEEFDIESIEFDTDPQERKILYSKPKLEIVISKWKPGAANLIRDNGNSHCIVRVLKGEMSFELFNDNFEKTGAGSVPAVDSFDIPQGMIHRMFNTCMEEEAITLHFFCPRVQEKTVYSPEKIKSIQSSNQ